MDKLKGKSIVLKDNLPINIIADDREHKSEVIQSLLQIESVDVSHSPAFHG